MFKLLNDEYSLDLPMHSIFKYSKLSAFASYVCKMKDTSGHGFSIEGIVCTGDAVAPVLSYAQNRYWMLDKISGHTPAYATHMAIQLDGEIDTVAIKAGVSKVVERHDVLRSSFRRAENIIVCELNDSPVLDYFECDFSKSLPKQNNYSKIQCVLSEESAKLFYLDKGPLIRLGILKLDSKTHVLFLATHHIILDGSHDVFFKELTFYYNAYVNNSKLDLPSLNIQYSDYAHWQNKYFTRESMRVDLDYWERKLFDRMMPLDLQFGKTRPATQNFHGGCEFFSWPDSLYSDMKLICEKYHITMYTLVLSVFQILLHRYSNNQVINIGTPVVNQPKGTEELLGSFINTLVMSTDLSGNPSFEKLLSNVRSVVHESFSHQEVPFEMVVDRLQPERNLSYNPLFQVMLVVQPDPISCIQLQDLKAKRLPIESGASRLDLLLSIVSEDEQSLNGMLEFNCDLFSRQDATQILENLRTLLENIVVDQHQKILDIPILNKRDFDKQINHWNDTKVAYEENVCIHQLFERRASLSPESVAVRDDVNSISYCDLNDSANRLAHLLIRLKEKSRENVAILLNRKIDLPQSVMAVLKSGCAYVPLDPNYPCARIQKIFECSSIATVICHKSQLSKLAELQLKVGLLKNIICIDAVNLDPLIDCAEVKLFSLAEINNLDNKNPQALVQPTDLAYTIFTSGSTGAPKGVMVKHQPVVNLIEWVNRKFSVNKNDQLLFVTSLCFDLSVYDIFGSLAAGATIRIASEKEIADPELLYSVLVNEPITFWDSAPASLQRLTPLFKRQFTSSTNNSLRLVFLSGDWIPVTLPDEVRNVFDKANVISLGGATEATVWSNYFPIKKVDPAWTSIPYGKPIQNARYYILNECLHPCPVGVPGELYIGGDCLATGYAGSNELTQERFLSDPFNSKENAIMYKTGDQAKFLFDGTMIFLGRLDFQVKIRGYRIELGEVESALLMSEKIKNVVVEVKQDASGEKILVAYFIVDKRNEKIDKQDLINELRNQIINNLPDYMLPSAFVELESYPLSANGKLDRRSLPEPKKLANTSLDDIDMPCSDTERKLLKIWSAVLDNKNIGTNQNFFELGGHSLSAFQVSTSIQEEFSVDFSVRLLFENPTIQAMAAVLLKIDKKEVLENSDVSESVVADQTNKLEDLLSKLEMLPNDFEMSDADEIVGTLQGDLVDTGERQ